MILGDTTAGSVPATTLDDLFHRAASRRPDALALIDPPNRESFTDGAPRRLTYAEADRAISAIAAKLRDIGLPSDAVVGIQLPNTVEHVLTVLGVLRAGMIAAPLPLLWRRADTTAALGRIRAHAIVAAARIGDFAGADMARQVAADVFAIRSVCGFGRDLADGVTPLDDLLGDAAPGWAPPAERDGNAAAHVALVSFDVTPDGMVAVARNHAELIAGGLATLLEGDIAPDARLLTSIAPGSFGGLALGLLPWLLSGGTLSLHHGFDADVFLWQCLDNACDTVVVPGPLVAQFAEAGLFAHSELKNLVAAWGTPERHLAGPASQHPQLTLTDILVFGETAVIGRRRSADGLPVPLQTGAGVARTKTGTLSLGGPMVPRHAFPPGDTALPRLRAGPGGFISTGYPCRVDATTGAVVVTGPPAGIVSVGSYRFVMSDVQNLVGGADDSALILALPDALTGHRLAGISGTADVRGVLTGLGVNPLIAGAFRAVDQTLMANP